MGPLSLRNLGTKIDIQCIHAKVIAYPHAYISNRYIVHENQNVTWREKRDRLSQRNNSHTIFEMLNRLVISTFLIFLPYFSFLKDYSKIITVIYFSVIDCVEIFLRFLMIIYAESSRVTFVIVASKRRCSVYKWTNVLITSFTGILTKFKPLFHLTTQPNVNPGFTIVPIGRQAMWTWLI